jgi:hypothetical protein
MKNHATHAINLKILKSIPILLDISVYFSQNGLRKIYHSYHLPKQPKEYYTSTTT